jgi:flagellar FliL protein
MSEKDTEPTTGENTKPSGRKKKMLVIVGAAVLLAGGLVGAKLMLGGGEEAPEPGAVLALEAMTVNLADGHYLKFKLALQATADAGEEMDGAEAQDLAITQYTGRTVGELSSMAGRKQAKGQLLESVKHAYEDKVMDIYFTEFVTQ